MAKAHAAAEAHVAAGSGHAHGGPGGAHSHGEPHLPHGSVWPFWVALGITAVGLSMIYFGQALDETILDPAAEHIERDWTFLNPLALVVIALAVGFLLFTLYGWFRQDFHWWKTNTGTGDHIPKAGTLLFISSEIFLFGALFATYFSSRATGLAHGDWPDVHGHFPLLERDGLLKVGFFSLFLFASSGTVHKAEKSLLKGDKKGFDTWWLATILLGLVFLIGQVWEYTTLVQEGFTLGSSLYITAFFMLTGTHGAHVFGGLVALSIVAVRSRTGNQFDQHRHAAPQCISIYWHFVDIVWVVVLSVLYIWPFLAG